MRVITYGIITDVYTVTWESRVARVLTMGTISATSGIGRHRYTHDFVLRAVLAIGKTIRKSA